MFKTCWQNVAVVIGVFCLVVRAQPARAFDIGPEVPPPLARAQSDLLIASAPPTAEPAGELLAIDLPMLDDDPPARDASPNMPADAMIDHLIHMVERNMKANACSMFFIPFDKLQTERPQADVIPTDEAVLMQLPSQLAETDEHQTDPQKPDAIPATNSRDLFLSTLEYLGQFGDGVHGNPNLVVISFNDAPMTIDLASLATDSMAMF